jgi:nucleoredoxin
MPWLAVKYSERDLQELLSNKFQIEGVPTLVVLNANTGMVLNTDAYSDCLGDAEGARFPWKCELDDE